ncbi:hypothetical protein CDAR_196321 [Caerostris darwini]|uniref:Uncharacterized protein n=1 Tax=Caerostris darwini TaxID=1538125 RepID=A0AAV4PVH2_9ARAC|nr:hypothetical protein CDAR_196321 [Caerostris darwini]
MSAAPRISTDIRVCVTSPEAATECNRKRNGPTVALKGIAVLTNFEMQYKSVKQKDRESCSASERMDKSLELFRLVDCRAWEIKETVLEDKLFDMMSFFTETADVADSTTKSAQLPSISSQITCYTAALLQVAATLLHSYFRSVLKYLAIPLP